MPPVTTPLVLSTIRDTIGTITLNNPARRNALSEALMDEVIAALGQFREARLRAVVLRATPGVKVWSAGHDVTELPQTRRDPLAWADPLRHLVREIAEFPAPIIALLEGGVWGGACEVAMACDLIVATPNVTFAVTPAKLGIPYNITGLLTFLNTIPLHVLKEMAFTAAPIDARRAWELGIVNHIVPVDEITAFVDAMADRIATNSPLSVGAMKESLRILAAAHAMTPNGFERLQGLRRVVWDSKDYQEGIAAFLEKRPPNFTGE